MKKVISSPLAPGAIGPYSQAIEVNGMLFLSGQLPIDAATGLMAEGIEEQAKQSLSNIKHILEEAGLTMANVVKNTVFLADMSLFADVLLGIDLGIVKDIETKTLDSLFIEVMPATLALSVKNAPKDQKERDILRAERIRARLISK